MRRHVRADVLALYREGAVSVRRAAGIESHLSGCALCTDIARDLDAVSDMLTVAPLPPMPDVLVVRIQAAIASESALRAATNPGYSTRSLASDATAVSGADPSVTGGGVAGAAGGVGAGGAGDGGSAEEGTAGREYIPGRPDLPERAGRGARRFRMPRLSSPLLLRTLAATGAVVIVAGGGFLLASGQTASETSAGSGTSGAGGGTPQAICE